MKSSNGKWKVQIRMANEKFEWQMKSSNPNGKWKVRMANEKFKWQMKSSNPNDKWKVRMANEKFKSEWQMESSNPNEKFEWQMKSSNPNGKWKVQMVNEIRFQIHMAIFNPECLFYMRTYCEFKNCACRRHVGSLDSVCGICMHGACWHKLDLTQFQSIRSAAETPVYERLTIINAYPLVPPLPKVQNAFPTSIELVV